MLYLQSKQLLEEFQQCVVLVILSGHSLYKPTALSVNKYFNSHSKFIAGPEAHGHCLFFPAGFMAIYNKEHKIYISNVYLCQISWTRDSYKWNF